MRDYLKSKQLSDSTIEIYERYVFFFFDWCKNQELRHEEMTYKQMLDFVSACHTACFSIRKTNMILLSIRHYYDSQNTKRNPAQGIILKGTTKTVPKDLLTEAELTHIFGHYYAIDARMKRNKVLLGILIYQGLSTEELHLLQVEHINLKAGKIYVPSTKNSLSRNLHLESCQILDLQEYLFQIRPQMLENLEDSISIRPGRKPNQIDLEAIKARLFFSENGILDLKPSLKHLFRALRQIEPKVKNGKQIRQSVIRNNLKIKSLMQVRQESGFKTMTAVERYQSQNLEDLEMALEKYHPLR